MRLFGDKPGMRFFNLFGGGGGGSAQTISPSKEYSQMLNIFNKQAWPSEQQWIANIPQFTQTNALAQRDFTNLPGNLGMLGNAYQQEVKGIQGLPSMIQSAYAQGAPLSQLQQPLLSALPWLNQTIASHGQLTGQEARAATQQALGAEAQAGMAHTNAGIASQLLNRDIYTRQKFGEALGQAINATQGLSGLSTAALQRAQGAAGSLQSLAQAPFQNALSYITAGRGLAQDTARNLYQSVAAPIGIYGSAFTPVGQNVADVINYNLNAQNAANIAAQNKSAGTTSGALGAIGSIGGGIAIAL